MLPLNMTEIELSGKRVLIREDLNVPLANGVITSDTRIRAAIPTLRLALDAGAKILIMAHLGRPKEGLEEDCFSLAPVAKRLSELLARPVPLLKNWIDGDVTDGGDIALCENVRFLKGEKANDEALAQRMAALCDVYIMDAFGCSHRAHASTHGVARLAPQACAGLLLSTELEALHRALDEPARPLIAVVGGAKVSSKLEGLSALSAVVDGLVVGGGIANTFLAAKGYAVGNSLMEADLLGAAGTLMTKLEQEGRRFPLPEDVVVAKEFSAEADAQIKPVGEVAENEMILDIGPESAEQLADLLAKAGTIVWNGPVGAFELEPFASGSKTIAQAIAASPAFSVAGGGDTLAAIEKFGVTDDISYISTGGGAFLEFLEGKELPAVTMLEKRAQESM